MSVTTIARASAALKHDLNLRYAFVAHAAGDEITLGFAIRDVAAGELTIDRARWDPLRLVAVTHAATVEMAALLEVEAKERQKLSQGRGVKGTTESSDLNDKGEAMRLAARMTGAGRRL